MAERQAYGDPGLSTSAVHAAILQWHYEENHLTLFDLAATYGSHLIKNHAFFDGNKRIALAATDCFLEINQWRLEANDEDLYSAIVSPGHESVYPKTVCEFSHETLREGLFATDSERKQSSARKMRG